MITNFKLFENIKDVPKIGDYAIVNLDDNYHKMYRDFFNNNIGQIIDIQPNMDYKNGFNVMPLKLKSKRGISKIADRIAIEYKNMPEEIKWNYNIGCKIGNGKKIILTKAGTFHPDYIEHLSSNKEDLEQYINAKKYNI
jgi:hypothetical protein